MKYFIISVLVTYGIIYSNLCNAQTKDTARIKYVWRSICNYDSAGNQYNTIATFTKLPNRQDSIDFGNIWSFENKADSLSFLRLYFKRVKLH